MLLALPAYGSRHCHRPTAALAARRCSSSLGDGGVRAADSPAHAAPTPRRLAAVTAGELTSSRARRPPIGLVRERVYNRGASCHFKVDR